jgi:hypothetical protein
MRWKKPVRIGVVSRAGQGAGQPHGPKQRAAPLGMLGGDV